MRDRADRKPPEIGVSPIVAIVKATLPFPPIDLDRIA